MKEITQNFSAVLPFLYLVTVIFYGFMFFRRNKKLEQVSPFIISFLILIHVIQLVLRGVAIGALPLATKLDALSLLALAIVCVNLGLEISVKTKVTGFFVLILALIIQSLASVNYNWQLTQNEILHDPVYIIHVLFTVMGYAGIIISAFYAFFYIMLNHDIKHKRFGLVYEKLPSLNILENMSIRSVQIGIITLGIGIILGHLRAGEMLGTYFPSDPKVVYSNIIWAGYFIGYIIAQMFKWRGRWMAYLSLVGFGIFILANISIIFIQNTFHNFN